jgi:RimJ/RimL family protein N-acetyltransferase
MLRKATTDDIEFLYELYMHPAVNTALLYEPMPKEEFIPIAQDLIDKGTKFIFLHEGKLAGMVKLVPYTHRMAHIVYVGGLAIHPDLAGQGLGQQLTREIIDYARSNGFKRIELGVDLDNEKATHVYEKLGFVREGILKNYVYLRNEDKYIDGIAMAYLL